MGPLEQNTKIGGGYEGFAAQEESDKPGVCLIKDLHLRIAK
jgi:hypothetical protein